MILRLTLLERALHSLRLLPTPVMDAFAGVLFGRILCVGVRRGVIEATSPGPCPPAELALRTGLDERASGLLAEAFAAAGYLRRSPQGYRATAGARKWLLRDSPHSLYHLVLYFETLHARWQQIEHALEHGAPVRPYFEGFTDADWRTYALGMQDLARLLLPRVVRHLRLPSGSGSLLDLGGSHALYSIACCRRRPGLSATVMDFTPALELARENARAAGMESRFSFRPGDLTQTELPGGQDVVLMFNIIHGFDAPTNSRLAGRALEALKPGGSLYILDQFALARGGSALSRFIPLMVGMNLLNEIGGTVYGLEEVRRWCGARAEVKEKRVGLPGVGLVEITKR